MTRIALAFTLLAACTREPAPRPAPPAPSAAPVASPMAAPIAAPAQVASSYVPMPSLGPLSGHAPRAVVVMLHGYGANGDDLRSVASTLAAEVPDAVFLLPDAPEPVPGAPGARQWFPLAGSDDALRLAGLRRAVERLTPQLDAELRVRALPRGRLALVGFSQGAMVALDLGLHLDPPAAAVVSLSGRLVDDRAPAPSPAPALLVHGTSDARIPVAAAHDALERLGRLHVRTESLFLPGVGHTITPEAMATAGAFLHRALP